MFQSYPDSGNDFKMTGWGSYNAPMKYSLRSLMIGVTLLGVLLGFLGA